MSIPAAALSRMTVAQRAMVIERAARNGIENRLWQAALGTFDTDNSGESDSMPSLGFANAPFNMPMPTAHAAPSQPAAPVDTADDGTCDLGAIDPQRLGTNACYADSIAGAARRTGIPETAVAAIVQAEAAKDGSGRWNSYSRNPRSSAAGLGQFLSRTWIDMAQRPGTWLNDAARSHGWLDGSGKVKADSRGAALMLRYDPNAAIQTIADYARSNLATLQKAGVSPGSDATSVARTAYLAHQLGPGDAIRYLHGGLSNDRARQLLDAQIGDQRAGRAIAATGSASEAHRDWLTSYVAQHVRPAQFAREA
ncbi:MAG: peptidoglycan-binding protein [Sphingomonas sp.]